MGHATSSWTNSPNRTKKSNKKVQKHFLWSNLMRLKMPAWRFTFRSITCKLNWMKKTKSNWKQIRNHPPEDGPLCTRRVCVFRVGHVRIPELTEASGICMKYLQNPHKGRVRILSFIFLFFHHYFYFPGQLVGGFTLSDLLDKPWSQVSSLLPPGTSRVPDCYHCHCL